MLARERRDQGRQARAVTNGMGGRAGRAPRVPGLILEVSRRRATVVADGRFFHIPAMPGWEVGLEVWVAPPADLRPSVRLRRTAVALVGAAAVAGGGVFGVAAVAAAQVAAVVSVDINPSIQLSVDRGGRVLHAVALDADARRILAAGPLQHQAVAGAIATIVRRAVSEGYLTPTSQTPPPGSTPAAGTAARPVGSTILVTVAPAHSKEAAVPSAVTAGVAEGRRQSAALLTSHQVNAMVDVAYVDHTVVAAAHNSGLSLGQQVVLDNLRGAGAKVSASAFKAAPLRQALADAGVPKADVATVLHAVSGADASAAAATRAAAVLRAAMRGDGPDALQQLLAGEQPGAATAGDASVHGNGKANGDGNGYGQAASGPVGNTGEHNPASATVTPSQGIAAAGGGGAANSERGTPAAHGTGTGTDGGVPAGVPATPTGEGRTPAAAPDHSGEAQPQAQASGTDQSPLPRGLLRRVEVWMGLHAPRSDQTRPEPGGQPQRNGSPPAGQDPGRGDQVAAVTTTGTNAGGATGPSGLPAPGALPGTGGAQGGGTGATGAGGSQGRPGKPGQDQGAHQGTGPGKHQGHDATKSPSGARS